MKNLSRAMLLALGTLGFVASAQAGTYIVTANGHSFDNKLVQKVERAGGTVTVRLPQIGVAIVDAPSDDFAVRASHVPGVRSVAKDITLQFTNPENALEGVETVFTNPPASGDDDFYFDAQWGMQAIDVAGAWNAGYRGAGAVVAVLDSGVACQHPDIAANLLMADAASFVPGEGVCVPTTPAFSFRFNHGTHVAGIIAAPDNGYGTIGVAPEAKIMPVKVLSAVSGSGSFGGIIQGIIHAADHGADVINMSLGVSGGLPVNGPGANDIANLVNATKRAVQYANKQNVTVVASAGNDARDLDKDSGVEICDDDGCFRYNLRAFPAQLPGALAISSTAPSNWASAPTTTFLDNLAYYSNYGQSAIAFAGPGGSAAYPGDELCTVVGVNRPCWLWDLVFSPGGYVIDAGGNITGFLTFWAQGTSMAAPHVSGVAALIIGKNGGDMSPAAVEAALRRSSEDLGKPGKDDAYGQGRVNAARAVQ